jgi:hypothetical protein
MANMNNLSGQGGGAKKFKRDHNAKRVPTAFAADTR